MITTPEHEQAPPRPGRAGRVVAIIVAIVVAGGLGGALAVVNSHANSDQDQIMRLQTELDSTHVQLAQARHQLSGLQNQVSNLNVPTDPLSAYDEECAFTPDQTDEYPSSDTNNALLWFPCTDSATTIPQPGT
jgi:hypothetical protein